MQSLDEVVYRLHERHRSGLFLYQLTKKAALFQLFYHIKRSMAPLCRKLCAQFPVFVTPWHRQSIPIDQRKIAIGRKHSAETWKRYFPLHPVNARSRCNQGIWRGKRHLLHLPINPMQTMMIPIMNLLAIFNHMIWNTYSINSL